MKILGIVFYAVIFISDIFLVISLLADNKVFLASIGFVLGVGFFLIGTGLIKPKGIDHEV